MKKWIGFFLSLLLLVIIVYWAMGYRVKNTLTKIVHTIPQNSLISVQLDQYHRGFFSSRALWTFKMHIPSQTIADKNGFPKTEPPLDFDMTIPLTIKHGPIFFTNYGMRFGIGEITTQPETHYRIFINYLNQLIIQYNLPSFAMHGKETANNKEFQFNWMGLSALLRLAADIDTFGSDLKFYGIEGSADNVLFKIGEITHAFSARRIQEWLWVGESYFNISSVLINAAAEKEFALEGFNFMINSKITNEALDFNCKLSLNKLLANKKNYGPAIIELNLKNLDAVTMAELNKQEFSMLQNNAPNLFMISLATELPKLLNKGPVLELTQMSINIPEGKIIGNFKLSLPKTKIHDLSQVMQLAQGQGYFKAPMALIKQLMFASIKNDLSKEQAISQSTTSSTPVSSHPTSTVTNLEEEAQNQTDKMLQTLVEKGFLKVENKHYELHFKLENNQLFVNGKLFTPNMLQ